MRMWVLFACTAIVLSAGAVFAADEAKPDPVARILKHADADANGEVTLDELRSLRPNTTPEQFKKWDANGDNVLTLDDVSEDSGWEKANLASDFNGDGKVSLEEAKKALPGMTDELFSKMDTNGDGVLSGADRQGEGQRARMRDRLHRADLNNDGKVTLEEAQRQIPDLTEERFKELDRSGDGFLTAEDIPKESEREPIAQRLRRADADGDHKVTYDEAKVEFPNLDRTMFDRFDKNGDGVLTSMDMVRGALSGQSSSESETKSRAAKGVMRADADGDGSVTYDELTAAKPGYPRKAFDRLDTNNDGVITSEDG